MSYEVQPRAYAMPLIGTEESTLDEKGRILVGSKSRARLGPDFTMCLGENGCITAYPMETWLAMVRATLLHDPRMKARQDYARYLMGTAEDGLNFDQQGRVVVPKKLREKAKITSKVKIVGCGDFLEIWDEALYEQYMETGECQDESRREKMIGSYEAMLDPRTRLGAAKVAEEA